MHVNPYLIIEDEKYLVDDFRFGFSQKSNAVGLPATFPVFQGLDVVIRGHYPGFFLERWACASGQPKLVELVLKPLVLGSGPTRVFTFFDAHLVHFTKNYSEKKNPPVEMHLKITAGGVRDSFSKSEYSAPWRETFEKPSIVAARSTIEEECVDAEQEDQVVDSVINECEAKIRAYMRMLRVGEGTGEITKSGNKIDFQLGYTTAFGENKITDLSDHPRKNYGGSSAAGAYQIMGYTWDDNSLSSKKKRHKINSFNEEDQDKFCVVLLKYHPGCSNFIDLIINGEIEKATRQCGIWI